MDGPPIRQACTDVLGATLGRNPTWSGPLVMERPWENCSKGDFNYLGGAEYWGIPPPDGRHIMQGSLAHVEHLWARIT